MKRFSFRLEKVLEYRESLQRQAQRDLTNARNEYKEIETAIARMKDMRKQVAKTCREKERQGVDVPSYQLFRSFLKKIDSEIDLAHHELEHIGKKVKIKMAALKTALMKKKTLEVLKESHHLAYLEYVKKEGLKELDELTITRRGHII